MSSCCRCLDDDLRGPVVVKANLCSALSGICSIRVRGRCRVVCNQTGRGVALHL